MLVVTNRRYIEEETGLKRLGKEPSDKGPNELRVVRITGDGGKNGDYKVTLLANEIKSQARIEKLLKDHGLSDVKIKAPQPGTFEAACEIFGKARRDGKNILFFVHGYNNDMEDVLKSVKNLEELYDAYVLPFSWPANGGGLTEGTLKYRDDKADARVSMGALNRVIEKIGEYHELMIQDTIKAAKKAADRKHPDGGMGWEEVYTGFISKKCTVKLSLLCHSMGNYLLKYALKPGSSQAAKLVFDNVALVAADTNNEKHAEWVERLQVRNRVYVVINEHDKALAASRVKFGGEQKARLGHYIGKLNADNARYIDVTHVKSVGIDHSYFVGDPVRKDPALKALFNLMFTGRQVERALLHNQDTNTFSFKKEEDLSVFDIG